MSNDRSPRRGTPLMTTPDPPQLLREHAALGAARHQSRVVTLDCGDACSVVPGHRYLDRPTADPHGASLTEPRRIRDAIDAHVRDLLAFSASPSITSETK